MTEKKLFYDKVDCLSNYAKESKSHNWLDLLKLF